MISIIVGDQRWLKSAVGSDHEVLLTMCRKIHLLVAKPIENIS